eukprot:scaffold15350_cov98-Isochrysis_galbana.AAC.1
MPPSKSRLLGDDFAGAAGELAREELGRNQSDSNQLILTKEEQARCRQEAKKEVARAAAAEAAEAKARTPQSKALRKKLEQIAAKKRKVEERAAVFATLSTHRVDATQRALMRTSGTLGQDLTKRQRLQRALQARAADIELDGMEDLVVPRELLVEAEAADGVPVAIESVRGVAGVGGAAVEAPSDKKDDAYWAAQAMGFGPAADYLAGARPKAKTSRATLDAAARLNRGRRASPEQLHAPVAASVAGKEAAAAAEGAGEEEEAMSVPMQEDESEVAEAVRDQEVVAGQAAPGMEQEEGQQEEPPAEAERGHLSEAEGGEVSDEEEPGLPSPDLPEPEGLDLDESDMDVEMIEALRGVLRHTPHLLPKLDLAEVMPPNGQKQRAALFAIWRLLSGLQRREMDALADSADEGGAEAGDALEGKDGASGGGRVRAGAEGSLERHGLSRLARSIVDLMDGAGGDTAAHAADLRDTQPGIGVTAA